ncbi:uncharacterized protein LOC110977193 [Acanthaster planci]|uniref:Uncharacterized protein LOC110977193 n=1 Tax=Acanthaster planci TaxID=133434 RepID=A0A8B7Y391_ACAPL|nr:uncharacterized protein LOC110977193 [Acanthaster planci]
MATFRMVYVALAVVALSALVSASTSSVSVNIGVSEAAQCAYVFSLDELDDCTCPSLEEAMRRWLAQRQTPVVSKDLVAHYAFEDDLSDSTANRRNGSANRRVNYAVGKCGKAAVFDGSTKVDVDAFRSYPWGSQFSVSVWFKRTGSKDTYQGIVTTGYHTTGSWEIRMKGNQNLGGGVVTANNAPTWNYADLTASIGEWHHAVMTYNGSQLLFYLDNQLQSGDDDCCRGDIISKKTPLTIGQAGVGWRGEFFVGLIDEVKIFSKALSASEVDKMFNDPCFIGDVSPCHT